MSLLGRRIPSLHLRVRSIGRCRCVVMASIRAPNRWVYVFGEICHARGTGAAIASAWVNTEAMQADIYEIAHKVAGGAHALRIMDRAAWHATSKLVMPTNITPILLPSRVPEFNPVEKI